MPTINLLADVVRLTLPEWRTLIADALHPAEPSPDGFMTDADVGHARALISWERVLRQEIDDGHLPAIDALTLAPVRLPLDGAWRDAAVDVDTMAKRLAGLLDVRRGNTVVGGVAIPRQDTELPADRQARRLRRLRELGGDMRQAGDAWHTTGARGALAQLVREETEAGRARRDKTDVRADLTAAATGEHRGS